ncbi:cytochrome P450 family protein [Saccharopolyspora tripterygii]
MSTTEAPVFDADFVSNLHSRYDEIRSDTPVQRMISPHGLKLWVITRYEDVKAALADPRLGKDFRRSREVIMSQIGDDGTRRFNSAISEQMLNMDPPDHTRMRKLVVKAFTSRRIEALRPRVEEITAGLLDDMAGETEVDLLDAFAFPLPIQVISELLGVEENRHDDFRRWTNTMLDASDNETLAETNQAMTEYLFQLIAAKREHPADDLLTALIEVSEDEDRLSEIELVSMVFLLLVAGHETTVNLIGNGVLALLRDREQWDALVADPSLVTGAVEEALRFDGPVIHGTFRHTREPVTFGGVEIPAGEIVWVGLASANHDPEKFPEPERFDLGRDARGHVAFGHGIHFCLGAQLARMEAQIALRQLAERFPGLRGAGELDDVEWRFSTLIHGLQRLPVRLA